MTVGKAQYEEDVGLPVANPQQSSSKDHHRAVESPLSAAEVMTYPAEVVQSDAPVLYAIGILDRAGFSQLPVVDQMARLVGTFRARDVRHLFWQASVQAAAGITGTGEEAQAQPQGSLALQLARLRVGEVCSEPLPQVRPDAGLAEVIARVEKWHAVLVGPLHSRPATDSQAANPTNGHWGIITSADLMRISKPYLLLAELELRLRLFIETQLAAVSQHWWQERVPAEVRRRAENRRASAEDLVPPGLAPTGGSLLVYASFGDYLEIILDRGNWSQVFAPVFGSREWVTRRLQDLQQIRNAVAHHRRLSNQELEMLDAYVEAFLRCLGGGSR
jgi:predicted transcriptional regulator